MAVGVVLGESVEELEIIWEEFDWEEELTWICLTVMARRGGQRFTRWEYSGMCSEGE